MAIFSMRHVIFKIALKLIAILAVKSPITLSFPFFEAACMSLVTLTSFLCSKTMWLTPKKLAYVFVTICVNQLSTAMWQHPVSLQTR